MSDNRTQLAGELFIKLYDRYSKLENKKYLCPEIEELTLIEIKTIIVIGRTEGLIKMSEIANQLGVTLGTPTVTIDRLIKKGYVDRVRDEEDRRQVLIALTEKGQHSFLAIRKIKDHVIQKIFGIVSEEQIETLIQVLSLVEANFDNAFNSLEEEQNAVFSKEY